MFGYYVLSVGWMKLKSEEDNSLCLREVNRLSENKT